MRLSKAQIQILSLLERNGPTRTRMITELCPAMKERRKKAVEACKRRGYDTPMYGPTGTAMGRLMRRKLVEYKVYDDDMSNLGRLWRLAPGAAKKLHRK